jgi:hypothetical protein
MVSPRASRDSVPDTSALRVSISQATSVPSIVEDHDVSHTPSITIHASRRASMAVSVEEHASSSGVASTHYSPAESSTESIHRHCLGLQGLSNDEGISTHSTLTATSVESGVVRSISAHDALVSPTELAPDVDWTNEGQHIHTSGAGTTTPARMVIPSSRRRRSSLTQSSSYALPSMLVTANVPAVPSTPSHRLSLGGGSFKPNAQVLPLSTSNIASAAQTASAPQYPATATSGMTEPTHSALPLGPATPGPARVPRSPAPPRLINALKLLHMQGQDASV